MTQAPWFEKADVHNMILQARVLDARGRPAIQTGFFGEFVVVKKGAAEDTAWDGLLNRGIKLALTAADRLRRLANAQADGLDARLV